MFDTMLPYCPDLHPNWAKRLSKHIDMLRQAGDGDLKSEFKDRHCDKRMTDGPDPLIWVRVLLGACPAGCLSCEFPFFRGNHLMFVRLVFLLALLVLGACKGEPAKVVSESAASSASAPAASAAQATPPNPPSDKADGPPTQDGVYTSPGCEGEGGCPFHNWRVIDTTNMLADQNPASSIVATLTPGEWVAVDTVETRLVPVRGVVHEGGADLSPGEEVYQLEYEGEGVYNYWIRGQFGSLPDTVQVEWETLEPASAVKATLGLWARVRRSNGQIGWVHEARFECMGPLAGDENCRD